MALRRIKSHRCDRCGRSTEQICEVWTRGSKEYCSRRCLDAGRLKAASRKSSSRAYIGFAFIIALLMFAFAATPRPRAQDNGHHLHHADYYSSPYADTQLAVYGPKALAVSSPDTLGNYKIAATKGSTMEIGLSAMNPKAQIMRTEDDATSATAYLSGQTELFATNSLLIPDLKKRNPTKEFEVKFTIRRSPAHIGVRMGEHNLVRWLDSFIFFNTMNGEIDRLHQKYLGIPFAPLPSL
jgi:hypothetical protein